MSLLDKLDMSFPPPPAWKVRMFRIEILQRVRAKEKKGEEWCYYYIKCGRCGKQDRRKGRKR